MVKWNLYIYSDAGLDNEPEFMAEVTDLKEAVKAVVEDFRIAHKECPNECVDPASVPTDIPYDKKYADDAKGAFFILPDKPEDHAVINIAAIYATCSIEYYVIPSEMLSLPEEVVTIEKESGVLQTTQT